jgi:L-ascorbate metabolism protein UlaG (beta-lactamase superfamily)
MPLRFSIAAVAAAVSALLAGPALARCSKNVVERQPGIQLASLDGVQLASDASPNRATITFVGHASYQIDTPQGVRAIADYNGVNGFGRRPDIVTMNNAHDTHFTDQPEDGITYVLRGWPSQPGETEAKHDVRLKDMRVWNVPTNARDWGTGAARINGNSIFTYLIGDLCIAHLGHLHHTLNQQQLNEIGRVDVVFVPVDGNMTLDLEGMIEVLQSLKAPLMIPMHYFSTYTLHRFLERVRQNWTVQMSEIPSMVVSKTSLPATPKVTVLPGY